VQRRRKERRKIEDFVVVVWIKSVKFVWLKKGV
jgi:hypothetical protein